MLTVPVVKTKESALTPASKLKMASIVLTEDQKSHLATPSYQKKTEKCYQTAIQEELSSTLVDPVSVLGIAKDRQDFNSEEASSTPGAKAKKNKSSGESSSRNAKDK